MTTNLVTTSRLSPRLDKLGRHLILVTLCGLLLTSGALAQEGRPEPLPTPEQPTPEASATQKAPDPNETLTPSPQASQVVDGDIIFTSPGQFTYPRDIKLSDNFGGLRFIGADSLTTSPAGAAIQFFGNNASPYNGQLYLDSGALDSAALIFRTARTGGTITERMRVTSEGQVSIGTTNPGGGTLRVVANGAFARDGVRGETSIHNGFGVYGLNSSPFTNAIGVFGTSSDGTGVRGGSTSGTGVYGDSTSGTGVIGSGVDGVKGESLATNGKGVFGVANNGNAIYGQSSNGYAGFFDGRVRVTGFLEKAGGGFVIDHPLDPANKTLVHSFVESPDMMNIYNGNVTLDRRGRATITMPAYFEALNRDFRYQLTAIGAPANLYVAAEIKGNTFRIAGGRPGMKVSWQVTGVRQDAWANANRPKIEKGKPGKERGTYLHPEAFGQPKEKGVIHARHSAARQLPSAETSKETTAAKRTAPSQR